MYSRNLRADPGGANPQGATPVVPYGGRLIETVCDDDQERRHLWSRMDPLPRIRLSRVELRDTLLLGGGAYSPLCGFMGPETYQSVLEAGALPSGLAWGLPVSLSVSREELAWMQRGREVGLYYHDTPVAVMQVSEVFRWDPAAELQALYGTEDPGHASVRGRLRRRKTHLLAGPVKLVINPRSHLLQSGVLWPRDTRRLFQRDGWSRVAAIHSLDPWQRTHEYLLKATLETMDGLLLHTPLQRERGDAGLPGNVVADARETLLTHYFPRGRVLQTHLAGGLPDQGWRARLQQAIVSQNYGCSHIVISGSDGRGVVDETRVSARPQAMEHPVIATLRLEEAFHCDACGSIATEKSCPHDHSRRAAMPEQQILQRLLSGEPLPPQVARPEVARILSRGVSSEMTSRLVSGGRHVFPHAGEIRPESRECFAGHKAAVLWMTGLSGAGKSTVAHRLERELLYTGHRVCVLDGDGLRNGLCRDLDFSRESRRENLRRAAEVARIMADAGMLVLASFISPYREEREMAREIIGAGFYEVYVEASLETCEARDPKGLYKRARLGAIPEFTGVSAPYEAPEDPDMHVNTSVHELDACVRQLMQAMAAAGLLRSAQPRPLFHRPSSGKHPSRFDIQ